MKKAKKFSLYLIAGTILVLLGLFYEIMMDPNEILTIIFVTGGSVIILTSVLKYSTYGEVSHDERTRRLGSAALSVSWLITFILVNVLFWIDYFELLDLTVAQNMGIILFFMVLSGAILQWLYRKKGDIN